MLLIDLSTKKYCLILQPADFSIILLFLLSGSYNCTRHLFLEEFKSASFRLLDRRSFRSSLFILIKYMIFCPMPTSLYLKKNGTFQTHLICYLTHQTGKLILTVLLEKFVRNTCWPHSSSNTPVIVYLRLNFRISLRQVTRNSGK